VSPHARKPAAGGGQFAGAKKAQAGSKRAEAARGDRGRRRRHPRHQRRLRRVDRRSADGWPLIAAPGGGYQRTSDIGLAENVTRAWAFASSSSATATRLEQRRGDRGDRQQHQRGTRPSPGAGHAATCRPGSRPTPVFRGGRQAGHGLGSLHPQPISITGATSNWMHLNRALLINRGTGPTSSSGLRPSTRPATSRLETHTISCIMRLGTFSGKKTTPTQPVGDKQAMASTLPAISPTSADERRSALLSSYRRSSPSS